MEEHIYDLHVGGNSNSDFYEDLTKITDSFLDYIKKHNAIDWIGDYRSFVQSEKIEHPRSLHEYAIEYLMIGVFWNRYSDCAAHLSGTRHSLCNVLYYLRSKSPQIKPVIDRIRGKVNTALLFGHPNHHELLPSNSNLQRLRDWLDATKDFQEEIKRIDNWILYLESKSPIYVSNLITGSQKVANDFYKLASVSLSKYMGNISHFLAKAKKIYYNREDVVFCNRDEIEYYFNWVASEILNRELRPAFEKAKRKIVLLPTCMSNPENEKCQAGMAGDDLLCTGCSKGCRVNQIRKHLQHHGVEVRLIPHASSFSKWLEPYRDNQEIGLVGVACTLNLIKGGYEMKALNIPSQCVFLNFCGCPRHWPTISKCTNLSTTRLDKILKISKVQKITQKNKLAGVA